MFEAISAFCAYVREQKTENEKKNCKHPQNLSAQKIPKLRSEVLF